MFGVIITTLCDITHLTFCKVFYKIWYMNPGLCESPVCLSHLSTPPPPDADFSLFILHWNPGAPHPSMVYIEVTWKPGAQLSAAHHALRDRLSLWEGLFLLSTTNENQTVTCPECCAHLRWFKAANQTLKDMFCSSGGKEGSRFLFFWDVGEHRQARRWPNGKELLSGLVKPTT